MANREMLQRKAAAILALIRETDKESMDEAVAEVRAMRYSPRQAKVIASALRKEWLPFTIKKALNEAGLSEEDIEELDIPELNDQIEEIADDEEEVPLSLQEDNVEFEEDVEDEEETLDLEEGKEYTINIGDDVLKLRLDEAEEEDEYEAEEDENVEDALVAEEDEVIEDEDEGDEYDEEVEPKMSKTNKKKVEAQSKDPMEPRDRNLDGEEKARPSSKTMKMDGPYNVSAPDESGATMKLQGSESNSLAEQNDLGFLGFEVPTESLDDRFLNHASKGKMGLDGAGGELVQQFRDADLAESSLPELDGETGMFGEEKSMLEFEVPTELDNAKQRKVTVAKRQERRAQLLEELNALDEDEDEEDVEVGEVDLLSIEDEDEDDMLEVEDEKEDDLAEEIMDLDSGFEVTEAVKIQMKKLANNNFAKKLYKENLDPDVVATKLAFKECDGCNNPEGHPVEEVLCNDCGAKVVLCSKDIDEEFCPGCNDMKTTAVKLAKQIEASNEDYGDELCTPPSGMPYGGKDNGDGGFKTKDKKGGAPKQHDAEDMEIDAGEFQKVASRVAELEKALNEEKVNSARLAVASRTAARMAERGLIEDDEIENQIGMLLESGMSVNAIKNFEKTALRLAMKNDKERAKNASVKTASKAEGIAANYSMPVQEAGPVDMKSQLQDIFMEKYQKYNK